MKTYAKENQIKAETDQQNKPSSLTCYSMGIM